MSRKYKFHNESAAYFISFIHGLLLYINEFMHPFHSSATVYWLDVFTRQVYFNVLEEMSNNFSLFNGTSVALAPAMNNTIGKYNYYLK